MDIRVSRNFSPRMEKLRLSKVEIFKMRISSHWTIESSLRRQAGFVCQTSTTIFRFPFNTSNLVDAPRSRPSSVLVKRIIKKSRTRVCFDSNRPNPSDNFKISTRPFCTPKYDRNMEMDFEKGLKILRPSFSPLLNVCVCLSMQFVQVSPKYGPITLSSLRPLS
jgi:hypothetical protein